MRILLDTHIILWILTGSPRLTASIRQIIDSAEEVYVSAASVWEVAIKARRGRIPVNPEELIAIIKPSGFIELPITSAHAARVARLRLLHADPFDRILVVQAIAEALKLVTADRFLKGYSDAVVIV